MRKRFRALVSMAGLIVSTSAAHATFFGGVDVGALWESNFTGATGGIVASPVWMGVYSGYVGAYKGFDQNRGAWVASVNLQANRLRRYSVLDNDIFGGSAGVFHDLGKDASVLATVGGETVRFSDNQRNLAIYMARVHFKEGSQALWVGETGEYDDAHGQAGFDTYHGYSLTLAGNWKPIASDVITVSAARAHDRYDVAAAAIRTSSAMSLGWLQELGHGIYIRAQASREYVHIAGGQGFYTTLYATGVGATF
ncbi:hypothetical protein [Acidiferrobacter sp.]|uniref:hypothetical protein n=1 Tax=Acidiferrobacter sp. TaxID=1872107 RepID=UPI002623FEEB|nr:hypothetical protein [Acidiferrobacter sp.]